MELEKCKIPRRANDCKLIFINAAIVFCGERRQEGTSLVCRHFFLSFFLYGGFKAQVLLCHTARLQSVTDSGDPAENSELIYLQWRFGLWSNARLPLTESCRQTVADLQNIMRKP